MGTMLQQKGLDEDDFRGSRFKKNRVPLKGLNDILVLTQPEIVEQIHEKYLAAGADIITTNTFNANYFGLKDYGLEPYVYEINYRAAKLALDKASKYNKRDPDKPRFVAGTIGPTGKTASLSPDINSPAQRDVTFDELAEAYGNQAQALINAGVDVLLLETVFDTLNARAALYAINEIRFRLPGDIPVMVSVTIDESGRNLSGQTVEAFYNSLSPFFLFSIGLNCSFGADKMIPYLERLSVKAGLPVSAHPNAGLPNSSGNYDQSPEKMAGLIETFCKKGYVNIVGGCCGSTPEHISSIAEMAAKYPPRPIAKHSPATRFSGLQSFGVKSSTRLIKIGEKSNVTGSRKFARLIRDKKYEEALEIARDQIRAGGDMLNISLDESMIDAKGVISVFLNHLQSEPDIANVPVMLDSSDIEVITNGLKCLQGRTGVNSISLKDGTEAFKQKAKIIRKLGAIAVVMAIDEKGQAETFSRKTEICRYAYHISTKELDFPPEDIILDPNVLPIGTGFKEHNDYAVNFIKTISWIKKHLPYAKVIAGVSNVSFAFRGNHYLRDVINSVFLHHCEKAGLDFAIINTETIIDYDNVPKELLRPVEDLILNRRKDATDRLINIASQFEIENIQKEHIEKWRLQSAEGRIAYAICTGISKFIYKDIQELKSTGYKALDIIQGPLMIGMNRAGELFSAGKMFLPQVIKSARVMNMSVNLLQDDIEKENLTSLKPPAIRKKILLATVEGDVHDIGKNIVAMALRCNNYEVVDLGVMVHVHEIMGAVNREKPDMIGLSGLISPSLEKMTGILKRLESEKYSLPVLMGGAATSALHTAVKAAPLYNGLVVHAQDAIQCVNIANNILGSGDVAAKEKIRKTQKELQQKFKQKKSATRFLSLDEARKRRLSYKKETYTKPRLLGITEFNDFDLGKLKYYINWDPFFHGWGLKGKYPSIFEKERVGSEAERLFTEAHTMLHDIEQHKMIRPRGIIGIFPANSQGDDVWIFKNDSRKEVIMKIPMLRQQYIRDDTGYTLSLADFIAPVESGEKDYIGGFAATTGLGIGKHLNRLKEKGDSYNSIMFRLIADRLVEASAEIMHEWVRTKYWGYDPGEDMNIAEKLKGKYAGIRPAIGYPAIPDHRTKKYLFELLNVEERIGVSLTDIYAMKPASSVSGFYLASNASRYFGVGKIGQDQLIDYARRTGQNVEITEKWLCSAVAEKQP